MIYPLWESLAEAEPRPNFSMEDKLHNLPCQPTRSRSGFYHSNFAIYLGNN